MTTTESQSIEIPFTRHVLANGLQVIVHEDHDCPLASVNLWYHVGSKNEVPGRTGFAHLFEHLMFEASKHFGATYFEILQRAGGQINGSTNTDRTNYWELVPSNAVELALWMEADRMIHMLPSLTDESFETQRGVVTVRYARSVPFDHTLQNVISGARNRSRSSAWMLSRGVCAAA